MRPVLYAFGRERSRSDWRYLRRHRADTGMEATDMPAPACESQTYDELAEIWQAFKVAAQC